MGGERSPNDLFAGVIAASGTLSPEDALVVFADPSVMRTLPHQRANIAFEETSGVIAMDDDPLMAVRKKRSSSLVQGIIALKEGQIDAFVSAGNTGALVAAATFELHRLSGVDRPALLISIPTQKGSTVILDVGATVLCSAAHLVQFASLGIAYQRSVGGIEKPTVALLNIGVESGKGRDEVQEAYMLLKESCPDALFIGNIEGRDVFSGAADVVVCDGFSGNIFLKTAEGVSHYIFDFLNLPDDEKTQSFCRRMCYEESAGALIAGISKIVIKCHGSSGALAVENAIIGAANLLRSTV